MSMMNKVMNFFGLQDEEIAEERDVRYDEPEAAVPAQETRRGKNNIVSIHSQKNVRVVLVEPRTYDETQDIADHLRARRPVILNLRRIRDEHATRVVDFLSGTVYALNGGISKIGPKIFLCTPDTVEIQGQIKDMVEDEVNFD